jgi:gamma-glutamylcyclotransferase (GGCT)/AIG2-like uncharacterized protein YtfP
MNEQLIFVYGTLLKDAGAAMHSLLATHCQYFTDGYAQGRLYEVEDYPGLIESSSPQDRVKGELYLILDETNLLAELDTYEGCGESCSEPHLYIRKKVTIFREDGETVSAWVYIYNHEVADLRHIESGDYLTYLAETKQQTA